MDPLRTYLLFRGLLLDHLLDHLPDHPLGRRDARGDVPGWVLVTLMTVGIVTAVGAVAQPQLVSILQSALNSVK